MTEHVCSDMIYILFSDAMYEISLSMHTPCELLCNTSLMSVGDVIHMFVESTFFNFHRIFIYLTHYININCSYPFSNKSMHFQNNYLINDKDFTGIDTTCIST